MPTITGNLSFAIIGQGRNPKRAFKVSRACDDVRYIVVAQKRRTTDTPFKYIGDLLNWFLRREGYTVYVLFGKSQKTDEYMTLSGPCVELTTSEYANIRDHLEPLRKKLCENDFKSLFDKLAEELSEIHYKPGCGISAINLNRDGKIEISLNEDLEKKEARDVASQIFFFVRDVCHVHQHHAPTSDTIVDVVSDTDETNWKRETLYALFRWVIQQKRSKNPNAYIDAKGVLAYARAFTEIHCVTKNISLGLPQYNRDATIESLDAGLARAERDAKEKGRFAFAFFNRIIPAVGLILAFLTPFYKSSGTIGVTDQALLMAKFSDWLNDNLLDVGAALILIILVSNIAIVFRSQIFSMTLWFDLMRLLYPLPYRLIFCILLILSGSLILLAIQEYLSLTIITFDQAP